MTVTDLSPRAREVLSASCQSVAKSFGSNEVRPLDILLAILLDFPGSADDACVLLGTRYRKLTMSLLSKVGAFRAVSKESDELLPGSSENRVLSDALWFADQRGSDLCTLGDLFYSAVRSVEPELFDDDMYKISPERDTLLWGLNQAFGEPPYSPVNAEGRYRKSTVRRMRMADSRGSGQSKRVGLRASHRHFSGRKQG